MIGHPTMGSNLLFHRVTCTIAYCVQHVFLVSRASNSDCPYITSTASAATALNVKLGSKYFEAMLKKSS